MRRNPEILAAIAVMFTLPLATAQQPAATGQQMAPASQAAPAAGAKTFSQQDLDTILAPIALYQDALLAQIFMASTYPLEIVEAARWSAANPGVKDKALEDAMAKQTWDPSVKSLTSVPTVLKQMNDKLDWTQKLGDAFLAQQTDVMATVQSLRSKAAQNGNLKSTPEQTVKTEKEGDKTVYIVESAKPDVVYVPTYNPSVVYGTWWYPAYPPYYMYPPGYAYAPGLAFATGVVVGAAIWGNIGWHGGGNVNINVNNYNNFNRTNISNNNNNWNHNSDHRKGVSYRDQGTAQKYNRGGNQAATQSREQFRGRTESAGLGADSRGNVGGQGGQRQLSASDRSGGSGNFGGGSSGNRAGSSGSFGGGDRAGGGASAASHSRGSGGGGFSSGGGGASTRAASSRGSMSRGGGGHGGGRGGGGRR